MVLIDSITSKRVTIGHASVRDSVGSETEYQDDKDVINAQYTAEIVACISSPPPGGGSRDPRKEMIGDTWCHPRGSMVTPGVTRARGSTWGAKHRPMEPMVDEAGAAERPRRGIQGFRRLVTPGVTQGGGW